MIWKSQGGGPWGGSPWGGGPRGPGGGPGPQPRGPRPPDLEEFLRRTQERFRRILPGGLGGGSGLMLIVVAIVVIWLASGFYIVQPDEVGIVLRFGAYNRTTQPGLNYHLPGPIETVLEPKVTRVNRTGIGYRVEENETTRAPETVQIPEESLMLTGDENIVDIDFTVFWVIKDAQSYLFNIRDPERTVKSAAESAMREVIGEHPLAMELATGRAEVETDTQKLLQHLLDFYRSGIEVTQVTLQRVDPPAPVIAAFRDVQAALADRARLQNIADSYRNSIVPQARGNAVRITQEAEAYRQQVVARAAGDAARFNEVYRAFLAAKDITLRRIYLETMEEILANSKKVIIDKTALGGQGVLPYLPLPGMAAESGNTAPGPKRESAAPTEPQPSPPAAATGNQP
ncbi:MAG TPA: FtsH protease activity modulator HflK [Stellaceae bacterium]|nr:FtsH protease activity modulator HflK [Stellaceae bacterium]